MGRREKGQLWQQIIKIKIANQAKLLTKLNRKKYNGMPAEDDLNDLMAQVNLSDKTNRGCSKDLFSTTF